MTSINILNYTEKSFVLVGDTKEYKDEIKNIGGKWNPKLKNCKGWIFSKKNLNKVEDMLIKYSIVYNFIEKQDLEKENKEEKQVKENIIVIKNYENKNKSCINNFLKNIFYIFIITIILYFL